MPRELKSEAEVVEGYFNSPVDYAARKQLYIEWYSFAAQSSVRFDAWLTKFSDKYESDWASQQVYGRNDPIQTFKGTKRTIQLSWKLIADHLEQAIENQRKVSLLTAYLYPVYDEQGFLVAPPLMRLRFMNWAVDASSITPNLAGAAPPPGTGGLLLEPDSILAKDSGLVGRSDGFSFEPVLENGVFDDIHGRIYPKELELSTTFHVFHTHRLGWQLGENDPATSKTRDMGFRQFPYGETLTHIAMADGDNSIPYGSAVPIPNNTWNKEEQDAYRELMETGNFTPSQARSLINEQQEARHKLEAEEEEARVQGARADRLRMFGGMMQGI